MLPFVCPVGLPCVHSAVNQLVLVEISVTIVRCLARHSVCNCVRALVLVPLCECLRVRVCLYVLTPWSHASFGSLANSTRAQINFATSTSSHMHRLSALVQPYSLRSKCSKNNHTTRCPKAIKANGSTAKITYLYLFPITNHSRTHTHTLTHEHRHIVQVATKMRAATACFNKQWSWR